MFYIVQEIKIKLKKYLQIRSRSLKQESTQMKTIEEAYYAGFHRGFWEGAGKAANIQLKKEMA